MNLAKIYILALFTFLSLPLFGASSIACKTNPNTGALESILIAGDKSDMEWLIATDGTQYDWVKPDYGWGLGFLTETKSGQATNHKWSKPIKISGGTVWYRVGDVEISVNRQPKNSSFVETYSFKNIGNLPISLSETGIYTPLNDNYPDARTCISSRTNVHIWGGENGAYINAMRMGGKAPHLGVVVTEGAFKGYEVFERGMDRYNSSFRGIFAMKLPDMQLAPGESEKMSWKIFAHDGEADFKAKLLASGGVLIECDRYIYEQGDTARVKVSGKIRNASLSCGGQSFKISKNGIAYIPMNKLGESRIELIYNGGKTTHADCLVMSDFAGLIDRRVDFILKNQQMNDVNDSRYGAFMVYDNDGDSIYLNDTPNCNPADRDEGRERVGMGVMLAKYYQINPRSEIKKSLLRYAQFVRNKLQTEDYTTYSTTDHRSQNRGYNYPWVANFYFQMYKVTGDKIYALDGYKTMQALFRHFGYGFYCIEMPIQLGLECLKEAGYESEYARLKADCIKTGDVFVANGLDYPKHEVNYEQSIVAPAIHTLLQLYQVTEDNKYLDEAKRQMCVLESFNGFQPSFHLNDIAIRHWDGYWFGKSEMFGDTFPHYWSCITGAVFYHYAKCTGDDNYMVRAKNIVRNNLCLFSEDGKGSCAYLYPEKVNGKKAAMYDGFGNDQDWALSYYMLVNNDLI